MSDNVRGFAVTLSTAVDDQEAEAIMRALRHIKGVADVRPVAEDLQMVMAHALARRQLQEKLYALYTSLFAWETSREGSIR
jgi:TorA maturation chaperone TorD